MRRHLIHIILSIGLVCAISFDLAKDFCDFLQDTTTCIEHCDSSKKDDCDEKESEDQLIAVLREYLYLRSEKQFLEFIPHTYLNIESRSLSIVVPPPEGHTYC